MELTEQQVIDYIISRGVPKQLSFYVKTVPTIRCGNDVFRTIVEMSYEMWRCDRIQRHKDEIYQLRRQIREVIVNIPRNMRTGKLRSLYVVRNRIPLIRQSFQCNGWIRDFVIEPYYNRYGSEEHNRIIETIRISIHITGKHISNYISLYSTDTNESVLERVDECIPDYDIEHHWMRKVKPERGYIDENGIYRWESGVWEWK